MVWLVMIVLGIVVGMIANHKGRSFFPWFMYGALVFPIGLTHAILLKPGNQDGGSTHGHSKRSMAQQGGLLFDALLQKPSERSAELESGLNWEQRLVVKIADLFRQDDAPSTAGTGAKSPRPSTQLHLGAKCSKCGLMQMGRSTCKACGAPLVQQE